MSTATQHRLCDICNHRHPGVAHIWGDEPTKSTAARMDALGKQRSGSHSNTLATVAQKAKPQAGTQALPVDTIPKPKRGRPKTITDMASYKAQKQRQYRAEKKAAK